MKIIYLSGNSFSNKNWIEKIKENFDNFSEGEILNYDHWQNGNKWIDLKKETEKLRELVKDKKDYNIFAKSIGTILTLKGIEMGFLKAKKIMFCGFPYQAGVKEGLEMREILRKLTIPVIFIQNEFDPVGSFKEVEKILRNNSPKNYQLVKVLKNTTHDYENYEGLESIARDFFKD
ncbi:MAG: alpha/beta family hydrolase [Candidatus Shapirobacteria bacterium]|jgi:pimeloyl-ACP methyl ester carboxylesterase